MVIKDDYADEQIELRDYDSDHEISYENMLDVVRNGLPKTRDKKRIIVVGAGIAGLTSAYLLQQAGHEIVMIEASDNVGGRVKTHRDPSGWLVELGAMRIPQSHLLVKSFIQEIFKLEIENFCNYDEETYVYVNGIRIKMKEYLKNPECVGYNTKADERDKTADQLLDQILRPYAKIIIEHGWDYFLERYDHLSLRQVLKDGNLSDVAIHMIGVLANIEAYFDVSLSEALEIHYDMKDSVQFFSICGGNDLLPKAFLAALNTTEVIYNARAKRVLQNSYEVIVEYVNNGQLMNLTADYVLMTPTPTALSFVEFQPALSFRKRDALRQTRMGTSSKIMLSFSERFWEKEGIFGGKTLTDLPSHVLYYMKGGSNFTGGLVFSYTWGKYHFFGIAEQDLIGMVLDDLVTIHGKHIRGLLIGGLVKHWISDPYALGDFATYSPLQRRKIHEQLEKPDGRIWFAGEYISTPHAWIESAVKSALRTAVYINTDVTES